MNRQFAWVLFGILLIHVIAITAFQRSNDDRRREHSRADLPSQEEMGTTQREELAGSTIEEKTDEQRAAAKQAYLDLTSVSEDVFEQFGDDPDQKTAPVVEEPSLYSPDTVALPVPAPLAETDQSIAVPDTEISRLETVLATETTTPEPTPTLVVPEPLERPEIKPVTPRNVVNNDPAPKPVTKPAEPKKANPSPKSLSGIDRSRLQPVQLRPLPVARPVLTSVVASKPATLPIATPVADKPARAALKPINLPEERRAVSPAPPILRALPVEAPATDLPPTVRPTGGRPDMKALPRVERIPR